MTFCFVFVILRLSLYSGLLMNILLAKLKSVFSSVFSVVVLIILMNVLFVEMPISVFVRFLIATGMLIIGLAIFQFGIELAISPMGEALGTGLTRTNSVIWVAVSGFLLGFFIAFAEPVLHILGGQIETITDAAVTNMKLVLAVSLGVGVCIMLGLLRTVYNVRQRTIFTIGFTLILICCIFTSEVFIPIAFDSAGSVTGIITVPFVLSLALGMANIKKDALAAQSDSFGLVGITSVGAVVSVLLLSMLTRITIAGSSSPAALPDANVPIFLPFAQNFWKVLRNSASSLFPVVIFFLIANKIFIKLKKKQLSKILKGVVFTFIGLFLFMLSTDSGFLEVGLLIGYKAAVHSPLFLCVMGGLIGLVIVLAEPSVHVLTAQIEEVTAGAVRAKIVLTFIAVSISSGVILSMMRILIPAFQLWHILLVGYGISVLLSFFVPDLFVGMAFDAGGVASGPMTATFAMYFAQGAAMKVPQANVVTDGLGVIATVALAPVLSIQLLGLLYKLQQDVHQRKKRTSQSGEPISLLSILLPSGMARKVVKYAHRKGSKGATILLAHGTVRGAMLHFLGITETRKELVLMAGTGEFLETLAASINERFRLFDNTRKSRSGIAFTMPLEYLYTRHESYTNEIKTTDEVTNMENERSAIFTIVNKGMANYVVDASLEAGARGGTILNARGSGATQTKHVFDIEIDPAKEIVLTIVEKEKVDAVVKAIRKTAEIEKDGLGILFVVPLDKTFGVK